MDTSATAINAAMQPGDPLVIQTLEQALALARAGTLTGIGLVTLNAGGGVGTAVAAKNLPGLYVGCDRLKAVLFDMMAEKPRSPIIRGRMS